MWNNGTITRDEYFKLVADLFGDKYADLNEKFQKEMGKLACTVSDTGQDSCAASMREDVVYGRLSEIFACRVRRVYRV